MKTQIIALVASLLLASSVFAAAPAVTTEEKDAKHIMHKASEEKDAKHPASEEKAEEGKKEEMNK